MRNVRLWLRFDGGLWHGWQVQPNAATVQQCVQTALQRATGDTQVVGCSRTDAGVHARKFCANFVSASPLPCQKILQALNYYLPPQVVVLACDDVPLAFHARYSACAKTYAYHILLSPMRDPFWLGRALRVGVPLDVELLQREAQALVGQHDFASFCAARADTKTTVRCMHSCAVEQHGAELRLFFKADGFLYHMVRIATGTLLEVARGQRPAGQMPALLAARDRKCAGYTAPAEGLWLWDVFYNEGENQHAELS